MFVCNRNCRFGHLALFPSDDEDGDYDLQRDNSADSDASTPPPSPPSTSQPKGPTLLISTTLSPIAGRRRSTAGKRDSSAVEPAIAPTPTRRSTSKSPAGSGSFSPKPLSLFGSDESLCYDSPIRFASSSSPLSARYRSVSPPPKRRSASPPPRAASPVTSTPSLQAGPSTANDTTAPPSPGPSCPFLGLNKNCTVM